MGIKMFCGELDGELEPSHISFRADVVRRSISQTIWSHQCETPESCWALAKKEGWRVVRVEVKKLPHA